MATIASYFVDEFWRWPRLRDYVYSLALFGALLAVAHVSLVSSGSALGGAYVELVGLASVLLEATLGWPQIYTNHTSGSTRGMSVAMVLMWLAGDLYKTLYFVAFDTPTQFLVCGCMQITADLVILAQVHCFAN